MSRVPVRFFPALLVALAGTLCFLNLSGRDLWEPNEPIAAQAAREMMARGDWLLPTVNGELYPDKPPLLFWGIGIASLPGRRITETTARIPSALAGLTLVLAVYLLSRRVLGARGALAAAGTLAVSTFFVEQSRYVQHDMLLCLGMSVGLLALFRLAEGDEPRAAWIALAALALGFGVLAKGPVALALPALVLAVETVLDRSVFRAWGALILAGLLALLPAAAYYAALAHRHGAALLESFVFRHNLDRFVAGFDHLHPWWFFLIRSPVDLLPASLLLPAAAVLRPEDPARRRFHRRLWLWILVPLVFFSFSASKRPVYLLPALPAVCLLCGSLLDTAASGLLARRARRLLLAGETAALGLLGAGGLAAPFLAMRRAPEMLPVAFLLAAITVAGSGFGIARLARGRPLAAHGCLVASLAATWIVAVLLLYPTANRYNSPRFFAGAIDRLVPRDAPLRTYGLYRFRSGYLFYTGRGMPRLLDPSELQRFLATEERVFCILPKEDFELLRAAKGMEVYLLAEGRAGRRRDCLISNRPG